jgi:hypothetical protein
VCGDAWDLSLPRPHEEGGTFARGIVGRVFRAGENADVAVELLQHGGGHFAFELCSIKDDECSQPVPLKISGFHEIIHT